MTLFLSVGARFWGFRSRSLVARSSQCYVQSSVRSSCLRRAMLKAGPPRKVTIRQLRHIDDNNCSNKMSGDENDNIQLRIIGEADHDRVLDFLRVHYYNEEPLTVGSEPKQQDPADEQFNMSNIGHGMSVMAVCVTPDGERVVGAVMAGPKDADEADHLFKGADSAGATKWGRILQFLGCIERDANVFQRYDVSQVLHAHVLGVDKQMRGRAIGARLMQELTAVAKRHGHELLTTDCSSIYSARLCERLGWECVNEVRYDCYLDKDGKQVFCPPAPHESIKTYAIRL